MSAVNSANNEHSVGSFLRTTREARGISIEEVARVTKIGKNYLTALEEDRYESLPNLAYAKGFLRAYASFLGLSGDEVVAMYERATSPVPAQAQEEKTRQRAARTAAQPGRRGRWIVPVILLALVAVAAFIFEDRGGAPEKVPAPVPAAPEQKPAVPVLPPLSSAKEPAKAPEPVAEKTPEQKPAGTVQAEGVILKLKVQQDCWLNITIDDAISQQYDLKPGDVIEWKAARVFAVDIGNAGGIEAELNGVPLKSFGETGKPAHVVLTARDAVSRKR